MENFDAHILPFLENDDFIKWVNGPDKDSDSYWEKWMKENPREIDALLYAKEVVKGLKAAQQPGDLQPAADDIWEKINLNISTPQKSMPLFRSKTRQLAFRVAASVTALVLLGTVAYYTLQPKNFSNPHKKLSGVVENNMLKRTNGTADNQVLFLVDGTKVTLQPGSSIRHTAFLEKDKREVYLDGDGFFEVAKDPNRPFYVYTNSIVLRVLGTSFNVTTNKHTGNITVVVKTGRVSVYKNTARDKAEFVLTPNQRVFYVAKSQSIIKSDLDSVNTRSNVKPEAHILNFNFDETAVGGIFETLEEGYGIRINYDHDSFSKCIVTTSLNDEVFEEKLKIICAAVNATYKIENNEVFIAGAGCK